MKETDARTTKKQSRYDGTAVSRKRKHMKMAVSFGLAVVLAVSAVSWDGIADWLHSCNFYEDERADVTENQVHVYALDEADAASEQEKTASDAADTTQTDATDSGSGGDVTVAEQTEYAGSVKVKQVTDATDVVELINDSWEDETDVIEADGRFGLKRLMLLTEDASLSESYGAEEILHYKEYNEYVLQFETTEDTEYAYYELVDDYGVENCFVDEVITDEVLASYTGATAYNSMSWGGTYMGLGYLKAEYAYYQIDEEVTVALIDTGVDATSTIFQNRIDKRHSFYFKGSSSVKKTSAYTDENGHGTHVAGVIADNTPENVSLMILRAFDAYGNSSNLAIRSALQYAVAQNADVVNMSFGWTGYAWATSTYLKDVLQKAETAGTIICCAAGNGGDDIVWTYPANQTNVLTVSAIGSNGAFAESYSNYGDQIDFAAPGTNILSTYLKGTSRTMSGTSMASPHVVAAAAYVKMINPSAGYAAVKEILKQYAVDLGTLGWDEEYGWGVIYLHDYFDDLNLAYRYTDYDDSGVLKTTPAAAFSETTVTKTDGCSAFKYEVVTESSGKVRYTTSDTSVAETDRQGYVIVNGPGTCTITATISADATYKRTSASYTLVVNPSVEELDKTTISKVQNKASGIRVRWKKVKDAAGYRIYRKTKNGSWKKIGEVTSGTTLTYLDKTAKAGKTYIYRVRAKTGSVYGAYSKKLTIKRLKSPKISVKKKSGKITVSWKKIKGAKSYKVYRKTGNGSYKLVATTTSLSWKDQKTKKGKKYTYKVKAVSGSDKSAASEEVTIKR